MGTATTSAWSYDDESFDRFAPTDEAPPDDGDRRSPFAHDRDRIIYATAFRRLAGKAQVVASGERGLFHTRLTHTLKVAQLGRRMAEGLRAENLEQNGPPEPGQWAAPDPDLVEAACLAHDIGHPPFGHVGERAIQGVFDRKAGEEFRRLHAHDDPPITDEDVGAHLRELGGFESNAQTFRLLTYLSVRVAVNGRNGLNLTRATLDATVKYPWPRPLARASDKKDKWNTYGGRDLEVLEWVRKGTRYPVAAKAPQAFEAQIMEWADDVTYVVHDLMDFFRSGQVPLAQLLWTPGSEISDAAKDFIIDECERTDKSPPHPDREELFKAWTAMARAADDLIREDDRMSKAGVQIVTNQLIAYLLKDVGWVERGALEAKEFTRGSARPMRHEADLIFGATLEEHEHKRLAVALLKRVIERYIHRQPALGTMERGQTVIVDHLIEVFTNHPEMLPLDRAQELKEDHEDKLRAAVDHVASLTEEGAKALYRRLIGMKIGNFSDLF